MPDNSFDAVVTDPPYSLEFMNKAWDSTGVASDPATWRAVMRVLKPGGFLVAFGGTRTHHRLMCAIEDAGFEIRDCIGNLGLLGWTYGSGFPKSLDVSKAIDKAAGAEREVVGRRTDGRYAYEFNGTANRPTGGASGTVDAERIGGFVSDKAVVTAPSTDAARDWSGFGTALKPAWEPIVLARKPLSEPNVAANVLKHGTGALNIDATRIGYETGGSLASNPSLRTHINGGNGGNIIAHEDERRVGIPSQGGRWPANVVLTHSAECEPAGTRRIKGITGGTGNHNGTVYGARTNQGAPVHDYADVDGMETIDAWACVENCPVRLLDEQSGSTGASAPVQGTEPSPQHKNVYSQRERVPGTFFGDNGGASRFFANFNGRNGEPSADARYTDRGGTNFAVLPGARRSDAGGPSRFFYTAKASRSERNERVLGDEKAINWSSGTQNPGSFQSPNTHRAARNHHPTVKPVDLMRWLCRLVTRPGGRILDPFAGSGSTLVAALLEGFDSVGIEREAEYVSIAQQRIDGAQTGFVWEAPHVEAEPVSETAEVALLDQQIGLF